MTLRLPTLSKTEFNTYSDPTGKVKLRIETAANDLAIGQPFNGGANKILSQRTAVLTANVCDDQSDNISVLRIVLKYNIPNAELATGTRVVVPFPPLTQTANASPNSPITIKWSNNDIKDSLIYMINVLFTDTAWQQP